MERRAPRARYHICINDDFILFNAYSAHCNIIDLIDVCKVFDIYLLL